MQPSPYDESRYTASGMHIQEISGSSSISERDLTELTSAPPGLHYPAAPGRVYSAQPQVPQYQQPYYSEPQHNVAQHRSFPSPTQSSGSAPTVLQSFPSWDPTWRSGGVSEDGRAFTHHVPATPASQWAAQTMPYGPEGDTAADDSARQNPHSGAYLGGWEAEYSEEDQHRLTQGEYRLGVGYDGAAHEMPGQSAKVISEERKAQRMVALEKEFGPASYSGGKKQGKGANLDKEKMSFKELRANEKEERARINAELGVGRDGRLITQGPKLRATFRLLQGILALLAIGGGIGGAFLTHPETNPPPAGKIPTWVLYGISVISFLVTFWTFAIRRCFRPSSSGSSSQPPASSGLVLPIFQQHAYGQLPGGSRQKSGGWFKPSPKKQKAGPGGMGQPMTVNLVLDQATLASLTGRGSNAPARYDDSGYEEEEQGLGSKRSRKSGRDRQAGHEEDEEEDPNSATAFDGEEDKDFAIPDSSSKRKRPGLMEVLDPMAAMRLQDRWKTARKMARRQAVQDTVMMLLWLGVSVWGIGFGERCPSGSGSGWCDLYNTALAGGVLLCVSFCTSLTFGILDLRRSRSVPRISRGY